MVFWHHKKNSQPAVLPVVFLECSARFSCLGYGVNTERRSSVVCLSMFKCLTGVSGSENVLWISEMKLNNKYLIMPLWLTNRSPSLNQETPADCEGTWLTADSDMDVCRCFCVSLDKLGALRGSGVRSASAPQDPLLHLLLCSHTWSTWQTRCHAPENTPWFKRED